MGRRPVEHGVGPFESLLLDHHNPEFVAKPARRGFEEVKITKEGPSKIDLALSRCKIGSSIPFLRGALVSCSPARCSGPCQGEEREEVALRDDWETHVRTERPDNEK